MTIQAVAIVLAQQWLVLAAIMTGAWALERHTGNSGYIDTIWTLGVAATAAVFALLPAAGESQLSGRQNLIAVMIAVWGARLGWHILQRAHGSADDPRYAKMKRDWGEQAGRRMFWFLQIQAVIAVPLTFSVFCAAHNPAPGVGFLDALALAVFVVALAGESIADRQLRTFASQAANRNRICDVGLWRYSRHPNYFFEWLHWTAYPLATFGAPQSWWLVPFALLAPAVMYWLLLYVSGVPPLEQHMLAKHGENYRRYQKSTNTFFPGPATHV